MGGKPNATTGVGHPQAEDADAHGEAADLEREDLRQQQPHQGADRALHGEHEEDDEQQDEVGLDVVVREELRRQSHQQVEERGEPEADQQHGAPVDLVHQQDADGDAEDAEQPVGGVGDDGRLG